MVKVMQAVAGIIFRKKGSGYEFLILRKKGSWEGWQFVQGEKEKNEAPEQAILREIEEETGIKAAEAIKKLDSHSDYWFKWEGQLIHKFLVFFLVEALDDSPINLSEEHSAYKWCSYEEALKEIKFNKDIFEKAYKELRK